MDKGSFLWLLAIIGVAALAAYNSLFPLPAYVDFARFLGLSGFMMLCVCLMLGPLAIISPQAFAPLVGHRRAIGLASFALVLAHFAIAFGQEYGFALGTLVSGLPALLASLALLVFVVLAATSTDWAVRSIREWKSIQRLAYAAFIFSFYHFVSKANGLSLGGFVNISEIGMALLGLATIALQVYGFITVRKRQAAAKAAQGAAQAAQVK